MAPCREALSPHFRNGPSGELAERVAVGAEDGQDVLIHATGYDAAGKETGTVTMTFASKDKLIKEWTKWDLSSLGKVAKVRFNMTGGPDNGYGFSMPAYYALDDITIEL